MWHLMPPFFENMISFVCFCERGIRKAKRISYEDDDGPGEDPGKEDGGGNTREGDDEDVEQVADIVAVGTLAAVVIRQV